MLIVILLKSSVCSGPVRLYIQTAFLVLGIIGYTVAEVIDRKEETPEDNMNLNDSINFTNMAVEDRL